MPHNSRVLIVDDSSEVRNLLQRYIRKMGYSSTSAADGLIALGDIQRSQPDLVLLDIEMPQMNGVSLLKTLKADEVLRHIPVIMISAVEEIEQVAQCIKIGAEDYLIKPPNLTLLKARVHAALQKKKDHDREIKMQKSMMSFNLHLQDQILGKNEELAQAYLDTLNRLVVAAEFRDEETGGHIARISRYSAFLAQQLGLPGKDVQNILYAAPLHDVGKIGVPDNVLLKNGKLTDEEFALMKNHTIIGAQILAEAKAPIIRVAHEIALTHHERWNGKGYPRGLQGEEIPISGRLVAIADNFDALTSKRPYKDPYPIGIAVEIIKKESGVLFDPKVVEVFMQSLKQIVIIKKEAAGDAEVDVTDFTWSERDKALFS